MEPCTPTPEHVRTYIATKLQRAAADVQDAVRAIRTLPTLHPYERDLTASRRLLLATACFISPTTGD